MLASHRLHSGDPRCDFKKNLPNKRHIGKQDPYCTVKLHTDTKRTKAVKRGGQHPEWDEEIRFELHEDIEDELARSRRGRLSEGASPPPPPPKEKDKQIKGGKAMRILCYADDPREPELIGEAVVDLSEVLKKGETDGTSHAYPPVPEPSTASGHCRAKPTFNISF